MFKIHNPLVFVYIQLFIGELLFLKKAPQKSHFKLRLAGAFCISILVICLYYFSRNARTDVKWTNIKDYILVWLFASGSSAFCWKLKPKGVLFVSSGSYAIQHMGYAVNSILTMGMADYINISEYSLLTAAFGYILVLIPLYFILLRKNNQFYETADGKQVVISALIIVVCIVLNSIRDTCSADTVYVNLYDFLTCLCCLMIQFSISSGERVREEKRTLELIISQQHEQHELSKQAVEMMGIKLHDIRSQIRHIQKEMNAEDSLKLDGLKRTVQIYSSMANTGNATADAILMEKGLMCEINGIRFSYIVDGAQLAFMDAVDIFSLLNNMLDNAIEGELKVEQKASRMMSLRIVRTGDMLLVNAENYCDYPVDYENLKTTKQDKANHGIGMKGIQYVVEKYHGDMSISLEDSMFRIGIVFPIEK